MEFYSLYNINAERFWAYIPSKVLKGSGGSATLIRNHPFHSHFTEWGDRNIIYLYSHELNNDSLFNLGANGGLGSPVCEWILVPITYDHQYAGLPDFRGAIPLNSFVEGDIFV